MPTSAELISAMERMVASRGDSPSDMSRSTFSTTTIASSTNRPMASTAANSVSVLTEKPNAHSDATVPSSTTGTARVGINVARQLCKNRYITSTTSSTASPTVFHTSTIERATKAVESLG